DVCGDRPQIPNVVEEERHYLKYKCPDYYKLVGPDTVVCYSNGTWSEVPRCQEDFCLLRPGDYSDLELTINKYLRNGEQQVVECADKWKFRNYSMVRCINGQLQVAAGPKYILVYAEIVPLGTDVALFSCADGLGGNVNMDPFVPTSD
ncbi:hypothetical protein AMECASPLE_038475, partial [Ameca splendens]